MSNVKISDLPAASSLGSTDVFPIVQSGTTKKVTAAVALSSAVLTQSTTVTTIQEMIAANVPIGNAYLTASVATNAITIAVKTLATTDPSSTDAATIILRSTTITDGALTAYTISSALSTVISSGSTLGCASSETVRIHVGAMRNGSTGIELFYWTASVAATNYIKRFDLTELISTTAEGGAGGADSTQTAYSTTARTDQPWTYMGYIEAVSSATAGQWSSISKVVNWQPGVPMPGDVIQSVRVDDGAVATGTTLLPGDDSIPEITEGDQYLSLAITPTSAINFLRRSVNAYFSTTETASVHVALFQVGTTNALKAGSTAYGASSHNPCTLGDYRQAGASTALTTTLRAGPNASGTVTFNGVAGARVFGGVDNSFLEVQEIHI